MSAPHVYQARREYYKARALQRYYDKREEICAAWRERYASDPDYRSSLNEKVKAARRRRMERLKEVSRAPYSSVKHLAILRGLGFFPDAGGMIIVPRTDQEAASHADRLCKVDSRFDWKYAEDAA